MSHDINSSEASRWIGFSIRISHSKLSNDTAIGVGADPSHSGQTHGEVACLASFFNPEVFTRDIEPYVPMCRIGVAGWVLASLGRFIEGYTCGQKPSIMLP